MNSGNSEPVDGPIPTIQIHSPSPPTSPPPMHRLVHRSKSGVPPLGPSTSSTSMASFVHETAVRIKSYYRASGKNPIATSAHLKGLGVELSDLPLDRSTSLVRPVQPETMKTWLNETRPWEIRDSGNGYQNIREHEAWWNARYISSDLKSCTCYSFREHVPDIESRANCLRRFFNVPEMMGRGNFWYGVESIYMNVDESYPHVTGILAEDILLPEERLTLFELFFMTNLTNMRVQDGVMKNATRIPVTIISAGGCNVRVLHGHFDAQKQRIILQKSNIMNFDEKGGCFRDDWIRLLCWLLAEPIKGSAT